jgi:hypothetical protein
MIYLLLFLLIGCSAETNEPLDSGNRVYATPRESTGVHKSLHDAGDAAEVLEAQGDGEVVTDAITVTTEAGELDAGDAAEVLEAQGDGEVVTDAITVTTEAGELDAGAAADLVDACDVNGTWSLRIVSYSAWCFAADAPILFTLTGSAPDCSLSGSRTFTLPNTGFGAFSGDMTYQLNFVGETVTGIADVTGWIEGSSIGPCQTQLTLQGQKEVAE